MWVSRKKYEALMTRSAELLASLEEIQGRAYLIGLERTGRVNKFTFARGNEVHEIETMGLIGDDLPAWKRDLLR